MRNCKLLLVTTFFCSSVIGTVQGSPYMSAQMGSSSSTWDKQGYYSAQERFEHSTITRLAGGYNWGVSKRTRLGLEAGFSTFKPAHSAVFYQAATIWYSNPQDPYLIEGNVQKMCFDVLGVYNFYATQKLNLFIKAGEGYQRRKFKFLSGGPTSSSTTSDALRFKFGLGLGYDIFKNLNLNLELAGMGGKNSYFINDTVPSVTSCMFGLQYTMQKEQKAIQP